jgi:hypothetical protein
MPGLDDTRVHRPDWDLMQRFAIGWQKRICLSFSLRVFPRA